MGWPEVTSVVAKHIIFMSDLHLGHDDRGDQRILDLATQTLGLEADALVIGGDISSSGTPGFEAVLELFSHFDGIKAFVPGNHDLWALNGDDRQQAHALYDTVLPDIAKRYGFLMLDIAAPVELGDNRFLIGTAGWYDYSFSDPDIGATMEDFQAQSFGEARWNDRQKITGEFNDLKFHRRQHEILKTQCDALPDGAEAMCVLHTVPDAVLLPPEPDTIPARFARAFLGSQEYGEEIRKHSAITVVVCGHTHYRIDIERDGVRWLNPGGGYEAKTAILIRF